MTRKYILIYSLLYFCASLLVFTSSASAQTACTPVVYAFRHAEDSGRNLTLVGRQHASLYPAMVAGFGTSHDYCPVGYVYSMYEMNPDGSAGTNNPFQTAQPLAAFICGEAAFFAGLDPYTTCLGSASEPHTALASANGGGNLYEYLAIEGAPRTTQPSATGSQLRDELVQHAGEGFSSAIFWSSQGLNVLGQAIAPGFTGIPGCSTLPLKTAARTSKPRETRLSSSNLTEAPLKRPKTSSNMYNASMFILQTFPHLPCSTGQPLPRPSVPVPRRITAEMKSVVLVTCHRHPVKVLRKPSSILICYWEKSAIRPIL